MKRHTDHKVSFHTTPNGLRVLHLHKPRVVAGYFGVIVKTGSRDEQPHQYGLSHFVEHTIFKGTQKRTSRHIINRMEAIGGELNAYTTKEETVVYTIFPSGNLGRAAELVFDLINNSEFPQRELDKEREVVAEEIDSYLDIPAEAIYDDFEDLIFVGNPLGHNILGNRDTLSTFNSEVCRQYLTERYYAENMVAFYAGKESAAKVFNLLDRASAACRCAYHDVEERRAAPWSSRSVAPPHFAPTFSEYKSVETHQNHTLLGSLVGGLGNEKAYATALLTNILGGPGMNSLLNVELREKRGLVYNVEASTSIFSDIGLLTIYFGCDNADGSECERLVRQVVDKVADGFLNAARLERAKKQFVGQTILASENTESVILGMARKHLYDLPIYSFEETMEKIASITPEVIRDLAASFRLNVLTMGRPMKL